LETPFNSIKWIVSQRRRHQLKVRLSSKHFEKIVSHSRECEIIVVHFVSSVPPYKLNGCKTRASNSPAPNIIPKQTEA